MEHKPVHQEEPICALATASGIGAIAVIRISGQDAIAIVNTVFKGRNLNNVPGHTVHFGTIRDGDTVVDEVLATVFRAPSSFTKEDAVEISCHGSDYIVRTILKLLIRGGARMARPGEFTQRAFLNGQFDLVQAEAVADLIAADSEASHRTALHQLRGGFSKQLASLREELIHFASLVELELDFGEEDVEFAGRDDLRELIHRLNRSLTPMIESFDFGNALKEGIPVAIIGAPNVGKSTLLNALLNEEKAIVTDIAGTTRDVIEDTLVIGGIKFRIIDTAGIRETQDVVESIGIERSKKAMEGADIILMLFDSDDNRKELEALSEGVSEGKKIIWVRNKVDLEGSSEPGPVLDNKPQFGDLKRLTGKIPDKVLENARDLRQNATDAEALLWSLLRDRQVNQLKFRRQHPVEEGFVIDFFCAEYRLGVELDGDVHNGPDPQLYDEARTERLEELYGVQIVRLSNQEVLSDPNRSIRIIVDAIESRKVQLENRQTSGEKFSSGDGNKLAGLPLSFEERGPGGEVSLHSEDLTPTLSSKERELEISDTPESQTRQRNSPLASEETALRGEVLPISARNGTGLDALRASISASATSKSQSGTVVTNLRHYEHLVKTHQALNEVLEGLDDGITGDFLAQDIRLALYHLGEITGTIVADDLLANIFSKFCIGK
jgi:tRNA modification GTPase